MNWTFVLSAAALLAVALALVLPPLLRREPGTDESRPLPTALVLAAVMVSGSAGLYAWIGTPEGLSPTAASPAASQGEPQSMEQAVAQLERRLREEPNNLEGWMLLGRSRMAMGDTNGAVAAYRQARELAPARPDVLVALAEAIAQAGGHRLAGEPEALLEEALRQDPMHQRALWFAGIAAWQAGDYEGAAGHWETLLTRLDPDSDIAASVREQLQAAHRQAGIAGSAGREQEPVAAETSPAEASVTVSIRLDEALEQRYEPGHTVFVFARAASGPGVPLAVKRFPASRLPTTVTLGPDDAMRPDNALTPDSEIVVGARISKSGSATPQAGDLEGQSSPVIVGNSEDLTVTIERELGQN